jgi:hypothetical protein
MVYLIKRLLWGLFKQTGDIEIFMMLKKYEDTISEEPGNESKWWQSV